MLLANITIASEREFSAVEKIWLDAFEEDSLQDVRHFLSHAYRPGQCLLWWENGQAVSMVFTLDAKLQIADKALDMQYIYAAATLKTHRGRGIFGQLLAHSHEIAHSSGKYFSFLRPALPSLFEYYGRQGYGTFFYIKKANRTKADFLHMPAPPVPDCRVIWPRHIIEYAGEYMSKSGGGLINGHGGYALCQKRQDLLEVKDFSGAAGLIDDIYNSFNFKSAVLRLPAERHDPAAEPFGMAYPLNKTAARLMSRYGSVLPYMGLALD